MAGCGADGENNRFESQRRSRIMGLRVWVKHGCFSDCEGVETTTGAAGLLWPSWSEIPLAM